MNTIEILKERYGYGVPIFANEIKIRGKSNDAIRQDLSRAVKKGEINREDSGIYSFSKKNMLIKSIITFEEVLTKKFIKDDFGFDGLDLIVFGYFTGQTFLHQIGISQQVPAVLEVTTNNTSCKRYYRALGYVAILKKGKTKITRFNYKALQFFDLIADLDLDEIKENKDLLFKYIQNNLNKNDYIQNIKYYPNRVNKVIVESGLINAFTH